MDLMSAITNTIANGAMRMMNLQRDQMLQHQKKISSGKQINSAADDAAGLGISKKLEMQTRGLQQANKNVQDGVSMLQTAEGGLTTQHNILQRIRMLAIQSSNDTLTDNDRSFIQLEVHQLISELDKISDYTEFNTKKLLNRDGNVNIELLTQLTGITAATYPTGSWLEEGIHEINVTSEKNVGNIDLSNIIGENYDSLQPEYSPNGNFIAFHSSRMNDTNQIYIVNADGTNPIQITTTGGIDPVWAPDGGSKLAFVNNGNIFTIDVNGNNLTQITNSGNCSEPAWSSDGNRIGFVDKTIMGNWEIYSILSDGSMGDLIKVSPAPTSDYGLKSLKNNEFIWHSNSGGGGVLWNIYKRNTDASNPETLITLNIPGVNRYLFPDISNDNSKILFRTYGGSISEGYYIADIDGNNLQFLGNDVYYARFSADNNQIIYYDGNDIYTRPTDLSQPAQILDTSGNFLKNFSINPYMETVNTIVDETFTFTLNTDNDGADVWSVVASVSGAHADMTSGVAYTTDGVQGNGLSFTLDANARFAVGDSFTINTATKAATIDGGGRTSAINVNGNTTVYKDDESTISATYGASINEGTDYIRVTGADYIFQVGANMNQTINSGIPRVMNAEQLNMSSASVATRSLAEDAISRCDYAINKVSKLRANVGAKINRLEHIYNYNSAAELNQASAKSRIEDADIAREIVEYTKREMLEKISMSMLTQSNLKQKNILNLFN